jgi:hypothetical protein
MALPGFSQGIGATAGGVSSANLLFSSAVAVGDSIIVHLAANNSSGAITVVDNVNANNYTQAVKSTLVTSTNTVMQTFYKLAVSSGAAASTYRVSMNFGASLGYGAWIGAYTNLATVSSVANSSQGTSTRVQPPSVTSSAASVLFTYIATYDDLNNFASTAVQGGTFRSLQDNANTNQTLIVGDVITSSVTVQPGFSKGAGGWVCHIAAFVASTSGAAAALLNPFKFTFMGVQ